MLIEAWQRGDYRFLLASEYGEECAVQFLDDGDELQLAMLEVLATAEASRWSICAAPGMQQTLTKLLLDCAQPEGGPQ